VTFVSPHVQPEVVPVSRKSVYVLLTSADPGLAVPAGSSEPANVQVKAQLKRAEKKTEVGFIMSQEAKTRISNIEIRNKFELQMPNVQDAARLVSNSAFLSSVFVSYFMLRVSYLAFCHLRGGNV